MGDGELLGCVMCEGRVFEWCMGEEWGCIRWGV